MSSYHVANVLRVLIVAGLVVSAGFVHSSIDVYEFSSDDKRERYHALTKELRCPKCQNQDIADSNAPIAKDMRREVHRLVETGASEKDVVDYMVERFGEFVTYTPSLDSRTYALWYGPFVVLAMGLMVIVLVASRARKANKQAALAEQTNAATQSEDRQANKHSGEESKMVASLLAEHDMNEQQTLSDKVLDKSVDKGSK